MSTDLLVLAAFEPELSSLLPALAPVFGDRADGTVGMLGKFAIAARACGVGLSAAAVGATRHIADLRPRAVVAVGTCGVYPGLQVALGTAVVAKRILIVDPASITGATEIPAAVHAAWSADSALSRGINGADGVGADVATTLGVTVDDEMAARIARYTGADVEHMEAHGMASACAAARLPFTAVLGVANRVGSQGRSEWRANHVRASAAAVSRVVRWLISGAPGLAL